MHEPDDPSGAARTQRQELLEQVSDLLDGPMIALSLAWLVLVVVDLAGYQSRFLEVLSQGIWAAFVFHFLLELVIAPRKGEYLRKNWLTALALFAPALRLLRVARLVRVLRAARAVRGLRLLRVVSTLNRGLRVARTFAARRGLAYVVLINALVLVLGAAGMYALERPERPQGQGLASYGEALWWTAMLLTTLGSEYWPRTAEGRLLAWLLALFAFSVFGYVTATLSSLFVGQDAQAQDQEAEARREERLLADVAALREEMRALRAAVAQARLPGGPEREGRR